VQFLEAWGALPPLQLLRLAIPVALLLLAVFVPGRAAARLLALGVAAVLPFLPELATSAALTAGWMLLWLVIAWPTGRASRGTLRGGARLGGLESGAVGLLLGPALLGLLLAGVARLDLDPGLTRRSSYGVLLVCLGLLHLMLRRHVVRAAAAFAAMGLGLQMLDGAVRSVVTPDTAPPRGLVLLATALAVALTVSVGRARVSATGSAWVSDAHDLHD